MRNTRLTVTAGLFAAAVLLPAFAATPAAFATHESSNHLTFDAVANSTVSGDGVINYVKGASGDSEETSVWQESLHFTGLVGGASYTVVVKRGEGDGEVVPGTRDRVICALTAADDGSGDCVGRFLELRALAVAQVKTAAGAVVAQATRTGAPNPAGGVFTTAAPGEITSSGDCRESAQPGSHCTAPGLG